MAEMEEREEELLVDPNFFTGLKSRLPSHVEHVEILPKKMTTTNKLSSYRYTAVVHITGQRKPAPTQRAIDSDDAWIDFGASRMDGPALLRLLRSSRDLPSIVAVKNIRNRKTILERHINESFNDEDTYGSLDGADWVSSIQRKAELCSSLSAINLVHIGKEAGFDVEVSWARQRSQNGGFGAVFSRYPPSLDETSSRIQFPIDDDRRSRGTHTNRTAQAATDPPA